MIRKNGVVHLVRPGALALDRLVLQPLRLTYDGFILNAPTIASGPERAARFMREFKLPVPYVVDPKTYAMARDPKYIRAKKRSWGRLLEHYGVKDQDLPLAPEMSDSAVSGLAQRILQYQCTCLPGVAQLTFLSNSDDLSPVALLAPYFVFSGTDDPWFDTNLRLLRASAPHGQGLDIYGVLPLPRQTLARPDELDRIAAAYAAQEVAGFFIWVDGMVEGSLGSDEVQRLRRLIKVLSGKSNRPVLNMFGGYLSALLYHRGLTGFCHSASGGEKRQIDPPSGHRQDVWYYIPPIHQLRPAHLVDDYLERIGVQEPEEFTRRVCNCTICSRAVENGLEGFTAAFAAPVLDLDKLRAHVDFDSMVLSSLHYLLARDLEIRQVQDLSLDELAAGLVSRAASYRDPAAMKAFNTQYLREWATGLRSPESQ